MTRLANDDERIDRTGQPSSKPALSTRVPANANRARGRYALPDGGRCLEGQAA